jgi:hypothetical protein
VFCDWNKGFNSEGEKSIEDLAVGDSVISADPELGKVASHKIKHRFSREVPVILDIRVGTVTITCSPEHPFWVPDAGWREAGTLQPGSPLLTKDGLTVRIGSIECKEGSFTVYNIEVEGFHTYYVSSLGILVHNKSVRAPWRGSPRIEDGNLKEGWKHIDARHVTGNHPIHGAGDLFAPGTTRTQLEEAANRIVEKGTRISNPSRRIQMFEDKIKINGQRDRVRVVVDSADSGRVITMFPVRSE